MIDCGLGGTPLRLCIISVISIFVLVACGATRKISEVGLREPASVVSAKIDTWSALRSKITAMQIIGPVCHKRLKRDLVQLAQEKVPLLECPAQLQSLVFNASKYLQLDDRSLLEGLLSSRCQGLARENISTQLQAVLEKFQSSRSIGRALASGTNNVDLDNGAVSGLGRSMESLLTKNLPLEKWTLENGEYVISDTVLPFFHKFLTGNFCDLGDEDFDQTYQSIQALENLERLLPESLQRKSLQSILNGLHKLIDQKVADFFKPRKI